MGLTVTIGEFNLLRYTQLGLISAWDPILVAALVVFDPIRAFIRLRYPASETLCAIFAKVFQAQFSKSIFTTPVTGRKIWDSAFVNTVI